VGKRTGPLTKKMKKKWETHTAYLKKDVGSTETEVKRKKAGKLRVKTRQGKEKRAFERKAKLEAKA